jgi:hypothetical protein
MDAISRKNCEEYCGGHILFGIVPTAPSNRRQPEVFLSHSERRRNIAPAIMSPARPGAAACDERFKAS